MARGWVVAALLVVVLLAGFWWENRHVRAARWRRQHDQQASTVAAGLFDGTPTVTYIAPDESGGANVETLVALANEHGYRFVTEIGQRQERRVVFERR